MNLEIGSTYVLVINAGRILTYTAIIISVEDGFVTFKDKFDKEYTYNKNVIVSFEKRGGK
jgi:hypothetical protein